MYTYLYFNNIIDNTIISILILTYIFNISNYICITYGTIIYE